MAAFEYSIINPSIRADVPIGPWILSSVHATLNVQQYAFNNDFVPLTRPARDTLFYCLIKFLCHRWVLFIARICPGASVVGTAE
jgi:hypothetical protein